MVVSVLLPRKTSYLPFDQWHTEHIFCPKVTMTCLELDFTVTLCSSVITIFSLQHYSREGYSSFFLHLSSSAMIATITANSTLWQSWWLKRSYSNLNLTSKILLNNKINQPHLNNNSKKPQQTPICYSSQYEYYSMQEFISWHHFAKRFEQENIVNFF